MGTFYTEQGPITIPSEYDKVKIVPEGFIFYREDRPTDLVYFPGEYVGTKHGIYVKDRWKLESVEEYYQKFYSALEENKRARLEKILQTQPKTETTEQAQEVGEEEFKKELQTPEQQQEEEKKVEEEKTEKDKQQEEEQSELLEELNELIEEFLVEHEQTGPALAKRDLSLFGYFFLKDQDLEHEIDKAEIIDAIQNILHRLVENKRISERDLNLYLDYLNSPEFFFEVGRKIGIAKKEELESYLGRVIESSLEGEQSVSPSELLDTIKSKIDDDLKHLVFDEQLRRGIGSVLKEIAENLINELTKRPEERVESEEAPEELKEGAKEEDIETPEEEASKELEESAEEKTEEEIEEEKEDLPEETKQKLTETVLELKNFFRRNKETLTTEYEKLFLDAFAMKLDKIGSSSPTALPGFLLAAQKLRNLMGNEHVHNTLLPKIFGIIAHSTSGTYQDFLAKLLNDKESVFKEFCAVINIDKVDQDDYHEYVNGCASHMSSFFTDAENFARRELQSYLFVNPRGKRTNYFFELTRTAAERDISSIKFCANKLRKYSDLSSQLSEEFKRLEEEREEQEYEEQDIEENALLEEEALNEKAFLERNGFSEESLEELYIGIFGDKQKTRETTAMLLLPTFFEMFDLTNLERGNFTPNDKSEDAIVLLDALYNDYFRFLEDIRGDLEKAKNLTLLNLRLQEEGLGTHPIPEELGQLADFSSFVRSNMLNSKTVVDGFEEKVLLGAILELADIASSFNLGNVDGKTELEIYRYNLFKSAFSALESIIQPHKNQRSFTNTWQDFVKNTYRLASLLLALKISENNLDIIRKTKEFIKNIDRENKKLERVRNVDHYGHGIFLEDKEGIIGELNKLGFGEDLKFYRELFNSPALSNIRRNLEAIARITLDDEVKEEELNRFFLTRVNKINVPGTFAEAARRHLSFDMHIASFLKSFKDLDTFERFRRFLGAEEKETSIENTIEELNREILEKAQEELEEQIEKQVEEEIEEQAEEIVKTDDFPSLEPIKEITEETEEKTTEETKETLKTEETKEKPKKEKPKVVEVRTEEKAQKSLNEEKVKEYYEKIKKQTSFSASDFVDFLDELYSSINLGLVETEDIDTTAFINMINFGLVDWDSVKVLSSISELAHQKFAFTKNFSPEEKEELKQIVQLTKGTLLHQSTEALQKISEAIQKTQNPEYKAYLMSILERTENYVPPLTAIEVKRSQKHIREMVENSLSPGGQISVGNITFGLDDFALDESGPYSVSNGNVYLAVFGSWDDVDPVKVSAIIHSMANLDEGLLQTYRNEIDEGKTVNLSNELKVSKLPGSDARYMLYDENKKRIFVIDEFELNRLLIYFSQL